MIKILEASVIFAKPSMNFTLPNGIFGNTLAEGRCSAKFLSKTKSLKWISWLSSLSSELNASYVWIICPSTTLCKKFVPVKSRMFLEFLIEYEKSTQRNPVFVLILDVYPSARWKTNQINQFSNFESSSIPVIALVVSHSSKNKWPSFLFAKSNSMCGEIKASLLA